MGFSPLANISRRIPHGGRQSPRGGRVQGFTIHYQYGVNAHGEATNPNREVSANYWITNEGVILPQIDENNRAWTSGSANYPEGAKSDYRNITVEVSNSPGFQNNGGAISTAAYNALVSLIADVFKRHGLGPVKRGTYGGVAVHKDFVATSCPGQWIMDRLPQIISAAEKIRSGGKAPTPAPKPTPEPNGAKISLATAWHIYLTAADAKAMRNSQGTTPAGTYMISRTSGGVPHLATLAGGAVGWVHPSVLGGSKPAPAPKPAPKPKGKTVAQLADEVMAGKHGNGDARKKSLGSQYSAVQAEVNKRLGLGGKPASKPAPAPKPNIGALADAVMRGDYGNGDERKRRLGSNYAAVQAEVNRRLYG